MSRNPLATMNPQQLDDSCQLPPHSLNGQKVQLIYKLFLLGNSRKTLERELMNFTNKAYEEVQGLFSSSCCTSMLSDLAKALDFKCQVVDKVATLLKELSVGSHNNLNNEANTNELEPFGNKASPVSDVLKIKLVLQNSKPKNSKAKAAQVCATFVPIQQQKPALPPLPTLIQLNETCSPVLSNHSNDATANLAPQQDASEHVTSVEKCMQVIPPPTIIESPEIIQKEETQLDPPTEITQHRADRPTVLGWASAEDVHVQHQKQTSSQLLHFLKAKGKSTSAPEATVTWQSKESTATLNLPVVKHTAVPFEPATIGHPKEARAPQTLSANMENQIPVFNVKRVEPSGTRIYSYVTATKTELWDIGDIFMDTEQADCVVTPLENKVSGNSEAEVEDPCKGKGQWGEIPQNAESEHIGDPAPLQARTTNSLHIPEFQLPKFEETEVVVSHIVNPGNFYVQQADSAMKLQALVTDSWESSSSYAEQNCIPDIGTKVMGWFATQEQWCRAQVTKICGVSTETNISNRCEETSIQVEVKRLDYGDTACLSLCSVKELTPEMASLPLQAVQVALANEFGVWTASHVVFRSKTVDSLLAFVHVMPVNGSEWSDVSVAWLHTMVDNRILYSRFYPQGPKVTVELFLERGRLGAMRRGASVSVRLTQNGHARHSKLRDVALVKKSAAHEKRRKQDAEWEKYLISCYAQSKK